MLHHRYALLTTVLLGFTSLAPAAVLGPTGTPVRTVDIDVENAATGVALTTPGDNTNALGVFRFAVPAGTYNIAYLPPFAARLADRKVFNVTVSEPTTNLGDVRLARGNLVTGRVVGPGGVAINGVDMDVENSTTGERIPTHSDHSDLTGRFSFLVPAGTVDVVVLPPKAARRAATILSGVDVTGDISLGTIQAGAASGGGRRQCRHRRHRYRERRVDSHGRGQHRRGGQLFRCGARGDLPLRGRSPDRSGTQPRLRVERRRLR